MTVIVVWEAPIAHSAARTSASRRPAHPFAARLRRSSASIGLALSFHCIKWTRRLSSCHEIRRPCGHRGEGAGIRDGPVARRPKLSRHHAPAAGALDAKRQAAETPARPLRAGPALAAARSPSVPRRQSAGAGLLRDRLGRARLRPRHPGVRRRDHQRHHWPTPDAPAAARPLLVPPCAARFALRLSALGARRRAASLRRHAGKSPAGRRPPASGRRQRSLSARAPLGLRRIGSGSPRRVRSPQQCAEAPAGCGQGADIGREHAAVPRRRAASRGALLRVRTLAENTPPYRVL